MAEQDWFMLFPENYTWSSAALIAVGASAWGGSEIGEIHRVCAALKGREGDGAAWFAEWNRMGEIVAARGEAEERQGHRETASLAFMRAANYIHAGERLLHPRTEESQAAYRRAVALFKRGFPDFPLFAVEPVEVPFEGGRSLPAYFIRARAWNPSAKRPAVVFFDGLDVTKEMKFFKGPLELVKRGMAVLLVDGPGTGEAVRFRGMPLRHDYEAAGTAAVDYLETRDEVDPDRIGVTAVSLGGYYAPRCAAFEKRFKACAVWGAIWDYHATWKHRIEQNFRTALSVPGDFITWVLGVEDLDAALAKLEKFTLAGVAEKITCPFFLTHGADDAQIPLEDARKLFDAVGAGDKTLKIFTREEGGAQHCQTDNLTIGTLAIADWLAEKLVMRK